MMALAGTIVEGLLLLAAAVLAIPATVLLVEVVAASFGRRRRKVEPVAHAAPRPTLAVLMPAHDEASGIAASIATVVPQLRAADRLLVVADNCSDDTAAVARAAGAQVVERRDPTRRGKGHALDFGVRALAASPPDVVVVVDADCVVEPGSLATLVDHCVRTDRPTQALYLMRAPIGAGLRTRIAEFAWTLRNHVRPLGLMRLGLPCQLMGTGMAFPWSVIEAAPLASGHLVEDMQLGLDLAARGQAPVFCPAARVDSVFPTRPEAIEAQRTRWEHGHLAVLTNSAPRLFWRALTTGQLQLLVLLLDLAVPPLAALVLLLCALCALSVCLVAVGAGAWPLVVSSADLTAVVTAVLVARRRFGRDIVSLGDLLRVPAYMAAKLPMYFRLLRRRQVEWVRTRRDSAEKAP